MPTPRRLTREQIARRISQDLRPGWYVNLGIGIPTLISADQAVTGRIVLHSENGILGLGPVGSQAGWDRDLIDAGKSPTGLAAGASFFDSSLSFAMVRGGHIDAAVVGAYQVSRDGDLANWAVPGRRSGGIGGAADLAASVPVLFAAMSHVDSAGQPKIVEQCSYPLTARGCVTRIFTDLAVIDVRPGGILWLTDLVPDCDPERLQGVTGAKLSWNEGELQVLTPPVGEQQSASR